MYQKTPLILGSFKSFLLQAFFLPLPMAWDNLCSFAMHRISVSSWCMILCLSFFFYSFLFFFTKAFPLSLLVGVNSLRMVDEKLLEKKLLWGQVKKVWFLGEKTPTKDTNQERKNFKKTNKKKKHDVLRWRWIPSENRMIGEEITQDRESKGIEFFPFCILFSSLHHSFQSLKISLSLFLMHVKHH